MGTEGERREGARDIWLSSAMNENLQLKPGSEVPELGWNLDITVNVGAVVWVG